MTEDKKEPTGEQTPESNIKTMLALQERGIHPSLFISSSDYEAVFLLAKELAESKEQVERLKAELCTNCKERFEAKDLL